jgi:hypothetical protein
MYHLGLPAELALSLPSAIWRERFSVKQQDPSSHSVFHIVHLISCDRPNSKIKMGPAKLSSRFESTSSSIRDPYVPQDQLRDHQLFGRSGNDLARLNMTFMGPTARRVPHQSLPIDAPKDLSLLECSSSLSNNKDNYCVPANQQQRDEDTTFSSVCSSSHGFPGPAPIPAMSNSPFPAPIDPTKALQVVDEVNPAFDNVDDILECLLPLLKGASTATCTSTATKSLPNPLLGENLRRQEERSKRKYPVSYFEDDIPRAKRIHSNHAIFDEDNSTTSNLSPDNESSSSSSQVVDQETIWDTRFRELCEFRRQHGNCLVRFNWNNNLALAKWVKRQRYQCKLKIEGKHSTLSEKRQQTLDDLGFVWDLQGALWEERLGELVEFRQLHGHCNVPSRYKENHSLSVWVQVQRRQYKLSQEKDKRSYMTKERIARLEETGFIWKPRDYGKA